MAIFLISYDLIGPNRDYEAIKKHVIGTYGTRAKPLESVWLVKSDGRASDIRDALTAQVDGNDKLLVVEVGNDWATRNIDKAVSDWMKAQI